MKTLYQILEARTRIQDLPFTREEFKRYCPDGWDFEDEFIKEIDDRIKAKFGYKAWQTFNGWVEGNWYKADLDVLYDVLLNVPMSRLDKMLGAGSYGIVIDCGDRVIKWFHKNTPMTESDKRFYEYCMKHPESKVFPIVYKIGPNYVVLEKLETDTPKCKKYSEWLGWSPKHKVPIKLPKVSSDGDGTTMEKCIWNYEKHKAKIDKVVKKELPRDAQEIFQWGLEAYKHLQQVEPGVSNFVDLRLPNLGERKNKEVVWFDI